MSHPDPALVTACVSLPGIVSDADIQHAFYHLEGPGVPAMAILLSEVPAGMVLAYARRLNLDESTMRRACFAVEERFGTSTRHFLDALDGR
jgi:hypothetical protein